MATPKPKEVLEFPSFQKMMKNFADENSNTKSPSHKKLNTEDLENSIFQQLSLFSQKKGIFKTVNDDPIRVKNLRTEYAKQIDELSNDKDGTVKPKIKPEQKPIYLKAINGALNRFELLLSVRQAVFSGKPFHMETDRLAAIREEYLRHKHLEEIEEEDMEEELDEEEEAVRKDEEAEKIKADKKKEDSEAKEREQFAASQLAMMEPDPSEAPTGKMAVAGLARTQMALGDPKVLSDNITQNLKDLNHIAGQALQNTDPSSVKMQGMALEPNPEQMQKMNQDIASLEKTMRENPNSANVNPQLNQVLSGVHQQYQNIQTNMPANNAAGQQMLNNSGNQMEQNVTQWLMTGQVARYNETFKNQLQQDWNAAMNPAAAPKPSPSAAQVPAPAGPQTAAPNASSAGQPHPQFFSMQGIASAHIPTTPSPASGAPSTPEEAEQKAKASGSPLSWPPKPNIPGKPP